MMSLSRRVFCLLLFCASFASCTVNPYAATNRSYKKQTKAYAKFLRTTPLPSSEEKPYPQGDHWVGTTNFNLRKPNFVVIHHTAQNSTDHTLKTFTMPSTQVSSHYVIGRDGKVYQMLHDHMRAWHGGNGKWGSTTDLNSSSIGIELDNNGSEPFPDEMINSLLGVLAKLKKEHGIPDANFIGHADIAPVRKVDPSPLFPWKTLADNGFGMWYDEDVLASELVLREVPVAGDSTKAPLLVMETVPKHVLPENFNPLDALRIIGYDIRNPEAATRAFKIHFIQTDVEAPLTEDEKLILYNLYKKYL
ncbi:N-acetylmuramoyl-L-alanine amidase [Pontibacter sp. HJ8]